MIYGITGRPGGGKSYRAVQLILQALKEGRDVVTNIPLTVTSPFLHVWDWDYLKTETGQPKEKQAYPSGALYILDECWRGFPNGMRIDQLGEKCLAFFKEHRHRVSVSGVSDDIFLITQDLADIPVSIRSLCDQTILCEKPSDIGIKGMSIRYYMSGAVRGLLPVHKLIVKTEQERLKPDVYNNYKSNTQSEAGSISVVEGSAINSTFFQSIKFKLMVFGVVSALLIIAFSSNHVLTKTLPKYQDIEGSIGSRSKATPSVAAVLPPVSSHPAAVSVPSVNPEPYESPRWRIVAWVRSVADTKKDLVYIQDLSNKPRRINRKNCTVEFDQLTCVIDGQLVTQWSGKSAGTSVSSGLSASVAHISAPGTDTLRRPQS